MLDRMAFPTYTENMKVFLHHALTFYKELIRQTETASKFQYQSLINIGGKKDGDIVSEDKIYPGMATCIAGYSEIIIDAIENEILEDKEYYHNESKVEIIYELNSEISSLDSYFYYISSSIQCLYLPIKDIFKFSFDVSKLKLEIVQEEETREIEEIERELKDILKQTYRLWYWSEYLVNWLKNIVELTKIKNNNSNLENKEFEVIDLVKNVDYWIEPFLQVTYNTMKIECPEDIGKISGDRDRLYLILFNLLLSVAKYNNNSAIALKINRYFKDSEALIIFELKDKGQPENIEAIAQIFNSNNIDNELDFSILRSNGLNFTVARKLARLMKGDITFNSKVEVGMSFRLSLPSNQR